MPSENQCAVSLVLVALCEVVLSVGNVDVLEPLLIRSPASAADPGDGFGWTAVFHELEPVSNGDSTSEVLRKTRLLVGAPKGTYPGGLNLTDPFEPAERNTGLVYSCPILGACEGVTGDVSRYINDETLADGAVPDVTISLNELYSQAISEGRLFDQAPDSIVFGLISRTTQNEVKTGQLMGSILYSNGEHVIACAPRWITTALSPNQPQPRGICFLGGRSLTGFTSQIACTGGGVRLRAINEGYCVAGSATVAFDQLHVGALGFQLFGGTVRSRSVTASISSRWIDTEMFLNKNLSSVERLSQTTLAYFGYLVMSGYVYNNRTSGIEDFLVSSPRDRNSVSIGRVYLFRQSDLGTARDTSVARGSQMGEFFGFSMGLMDLNGDGYDDLVVGAPMYSRLRDPIRVEQGRVYIFFNIPATGRFNDVPVILENSEPRSRFGYAIGDVGDLNADGYEDVVIGAPYESSKFNNLGAVYVYYGSPSSEEFRTQTPQKITADSIVSSLSSLTTLRTFGFSITGNVDLDTNSYKDIAVGCYLEQTVIVLRSLPVVTVETVVVPIPNIIVDLNPSFTVTITAQYQGVAVTGNIQVPFVLSEQVRDNQMPRLVFPNEGRGIFTLSSPRVVSELMMVVNSTDDFTATEPYELLLMLSDTSLRPSPGVVHGQEEFSDFSTFPVVIQRGSKSFMVGIDNPCGVDVCVSDVALSVSNTTARPVIVQGQVPSVAVVLYYTVLGPEEGRDIQLAFSDFPTRIFTMVTVTSDDQEGSAFPCVSGVYITCRLQNRLFVNRTYSVVANLFVNNSALRGDEENFNIIVSVGVANGSNHSEINPDNGVAVVPFSVTSSSTISTQLLFSKEVVNYDGSPPVKPTSPNDLGSSVRLVLTFTNEGPSDILDANVIIKFPQPATPGGYWLYPVNLEAVVTRLGAMYGTVASCSSAGLNPDNLNNQSATVRQKRGATFSSVSGAAQNFRTKRSSPARVLDCDSEQCVVFTCNIKRLTADFVDIILEAVVDERYLASRNNFYAFTVESEVIVTEGFQQTTRTSSTTIRLEPSTVQAGNQNQLIHIIVWSSVGSFIVLVVIIILLYFVGFFKRKPKNKEELEYDEAAFDNKEVYEVVDAQETKT